MFFSAPGRPPSSKLSIICIALLFLVSLAHFICSACALRLQGSAASKSMVFVTNLNWETGWQSLKVRLALDKSVSAPHLHKSPYERGVASNGCTYIFSLATRARRERGGRGGTRISDSCVRFHFVGDEESEGQRAGFLSVLVGCESCRSASHSCSVRDTKRAMSTAVEPRHFR